MTADEAQECNEKGSFKKSATSPQKALEDQKGSASDGPCRDQPESTQPGPAAIEYLPQLKPGPNGEVDWTPLGAMTGTRPAVNKYSISRFSLSEWRAHNDRVLDPTTINEANIVDYNAKTAVMQAYGSVDKEQNDNTQRLRQKAKDLFRWKVEVEKATKALTEEVHHLETERQRLKGASRVLMLPMAISKECLELRTNRFQPDLVADLAEQELIKEMELVNEVRDTFRKTLQDIEEQMATNKAAKQKIEYDFCDKELSYQTEVQNIGLNTKSSTIMFRPGSVRFADNTAPLEYWEFFCRENIENCEAARQKSQDLRGSLHAVLVSGGRKLRMQADRTDMALAETVAMTQELATRLEETLRTTLRKLADIEKLIDDLQTAIRGMDAAMKLAQSRLDNRNIYRPHGENVRDQPHLGLIGEVRRIHETVTSLLGQLRNTQRVREDLMRSRISLERAIASKRLTLNIDRDRCGVIRSHYPSALELAGY